MTLRQPKLAWLIGGVLLAFGVTGAVAELAELELRNGLRLRGDVTISGDELILKNAAGQVRILRRDVVDLKFVQPAPSESAPARPSAPLETPAEAVESPPTEVPTGDDLPTPELLTREQISRLRLHELMLEGDPERVRIEFKKAQRGEDLATEVLARLRRNDDFQPEWEAILRRGRPHEKLQLIARLTGDEYADYIEIESDTEVFAAFRKDVMPLINRSCARSGCHYGQNARVFRFPVGTKSNERFIYTTFLLLDEMSSRHGPMINREEPSDSVLLSYMLPQEDISDGHPPIEGGAPFKPVLRGYDDTEWAAVRDWVSMLVTPRPDYGLDYENPYRGLVTTEPARDAAPKQSDDDATTRPAATSDDAAAPDE